MAKVTLLPFIQSISGRVGNLCFRTSGGKTSVFFAKEKTRTTLPSEAELKAREIFALRAKMVNNIMRNDPSVTRAEAWKIVKQLPE
ncbi:MAG: hypothetical protein IJ047_00555 [Paludibacteraceae bacterium]|nr:hypothetical protein [Paludibacteraceae bacterium]